MEQHVELRMELERALTEQYERMARRFDAFAERVEGHVRLVVKGHAVLEQRLEELRRKAQQDVAKLDRRMTRLEAKG